jgi:hypothetical protein
MIDMNMRFKASVVEGINQSHVASSIDYPVPAPTSGWLREIQATVGVRDYWAEMKRSRASIAIIQRGDFRNTPFTPTEQRQIAAQLKEVTKQVQQLYGLSRRQITQVNEKLDVIIEDASRLGRKDWVVIFAGTILPAGTYRCSDVGGGASYFGNGPSWTRSSVHGGIELPTDTAAANSVTG